MADPVTPSKGLTLPSLGGDFGLWGQLLNNNLSLIDSAAGGTLFLAVTGNSILTSVQTQYTGYKFTGSLSGNSSITWPAFSGLAAIENSTLGGYAIICGVSGGSTVTISGGTTLAVWSDGTNFLPLSLFAGGGSASTTGSGALVLQVMPTIITPNVSGFLTLQGTVSGASVLTAPVSGGGTIFFPPGNKTLAATDLSNVTLTGDVSNTNTSISVINLSNVANNSLAPAGLASGYVTLGSTRLNIGAAIGTSGVSGVGVLNSTIVNSSQFLSSVSGLVTTQTTPNGSVGQGALSFTTTRVSGYGQYGNSLNHYEVTTATPSTQFDIATTAWATHTNLTGGQIFGGWFGANTPAFNLGQTYTGGAAIAAELNYGNRWSNFGLQTDVGGTRYTVGLQVTPDVIPATGSDNAVALTSITTGSPGTFVLTSHGFYINMGVVFEGSLGLAGISDGTTYYVVSGGFTANNFEVSTSIGGSAVNLTGAPSGTLKVLPSWPGSFGIVHSPSLHGHQTYIHQLVRTDATAPGGYIHYDNGASVVTNQPQSWARLGGHFTDGLDMTNAIFSNNIGVALTTNQQVWLDSGVVVGNAGNITISAGPGSTHGTLASNNFGTNTLTWNSSGVTVSGALTSAVINSTSGQFTTIAVFGGTSGTIAEFAAGNGNYSVGSAQLTNNLASGVNQYCTTFSSYGINNQPGGFVYGFFARSDLNTSGAALTEFDVFNNSGNFSGVMPPNTVFGTTDNITIDLLLAAYGNYPSAIGLYLAGGAAPSHQSFVNGIYFHPQSCTNYGLFIDATATSGAAVGALIRSTATAPALQLEVMGNPSPSLSVLTTYNSGGTPLSWMRANGDIGNAGVNIGANGTITTAVVSGARRPILTPSSSYQLLTTDSNSCFTNLTSGLYVLPASGVAVAGTYYTFAVVTSGNTLLVSGGSSIKIALGTTVSVSGLISSNSPYSSLTLLCVSGNLWVADRATGSWIVT